MKNAFKVGEDELTVKDEEKQFYTTFIIHGSQKEEIILRVQLALVSRRERCLSRNALCASSIWPLLSVLQRTWKQPTCLLSLDKQRKCGIYTTGKSTETESKSIARGRKGGEDSGITANIYWVSSRVRKMFQNQIFVMVAHSSWRWHSNQ